MKKLLNYTLSGFLALAFIGCAFDPNYRKVRFLGDQPYYIPQDTKFWLSSESDIGTRLSEAGIKCEENSVIWVADEEIQKSPHLSKELIRELYSQNKLGCANPISDQQLEYIKHKEILEQEEWQRQQEEWQRQREMQQLRDMQRERLDREDERFKKMFKKY